MAGRRDRIEIRVEPNVNARAFEAGLRRAFGQMEGQARQAAEAMEAALMGAAGGADRAADRISDSLSGIDLRRLFEGTDFRGLADELLGDLERVGDRAGEALDPGGDPVRRFAELVDRIASRFGTELPDAARIAGRQIGEGLGAPADRVGLQWNRSLVEVAADLRRLSATLPPEARGIGERIAAEMDPRPHAERSFDGLQGDLAGVARRLPPEFRSAANEMSDAIARAARSSAEAMEAAANESVAAWARSQGRMRSVARGVGDALQAGMRGVGVRVAAALDPGQQVSRQFAQLRTVVGQVAAQLPAPMVAAGARIRDVFRVTGAQIPPPLERGADRAGDAFRRLPDQARDSGRGITEAFRSAASRIPSQFDGLSDQIGRRFSGLRNTLQIAIGNVIADVVGSASAGIGDFFSGGGQVAASQEAARAFARTVFGGFSREIEAFAETSARTIGVSERVALEGAAALGNQFAQLGAPQEEAKRRTLELLEVVGDLAAAGNADPGRIIESFQAANRGEFDSLQRYIPRINAALIAETALIQTRKTNANELTELEKAYAAQTLILEGVGPAQGAFNRQLDTAAVQTAIYRAEMENLQIQLGEKMLPATLAWQRAKLFLASILVDKVLPAVEEIGGELRRVFGPVIAQVGPQVRLFWEQHLSPALDRIREGFTQFFDGLTGEVTLDAPDLTAWERLGATIRQFFSALFTGEIDGDQASAVERIGLAIRGAFQWLVDNWVVVVGALAAIGGALVVLKTFAVITALVSAGPWLLAAAAVAAVGGAVAYAWENFPLFREAVQDFWAAAEPIFTQLGEIVVDVIRLIVIILGGFWKLMVRGWELAGDEVMSVLGRFFSGMERTFKGVLDVIQGILGVFIAAFTGDWQGLWDSYKQILEGVLGIIVGLFESSFGTVFEFLRTAAGTIASLAGSMWDGLTNGLIDAVNFAIGGVNRLITELNKLPKVNIGLIDQIGAPRRSRGFTAPVFADVAAAAKGDVVFDRQIRLVGDNFGARSDPEIIAPQSFIEAAVARGLAAAGAGGRGSFIEHADIHVTDGRDIFSELAMAQRLYAL